MDDLFIPLIKQREAIYNKAHPDYSKKDSVVYNIWSLISIEMRAQNYLEFVGKWVK